MPVAERKVRKVGMLKSSGDLGTSFLDSSSSLLVERHAVCQMHQSRGDDVRVAA